MVTYDELFALRVSFQDDYTDEADIIRQLKTYLLQSLQLEEVDEYLHNFYNSFGISISIDDLKEIRLDRRQVRRIQRNNLNSLNRFSTTFFPSQNTPTIPENTTDSADSTESNTNNLTESNNPTNRIQSIQSNQSNSVNSINNQDLDQILDEVINNMEEQEDDDLISEEEVEDSDDEMNPTDSNNMQEDYDEQMDLNNPFNPNNLSQYFQVDESGNVNLAPHLLSGFFLGSSQDSSDISSNLNNVNEGYNQILSSYNELANLMENNPIYPMFPQFTVNLPNSMDELVDSSNQSNPIDSYNQQDNTNPSDSIDVNQNEMNPIDSIVNTETDVSNVDSVNSAQNTNSVAPASRGRVRNNLIRRLNTGNQSRRVQRRSTLGPSQLMQTAFNGLIFPQQMQGFYSNLQMPTPGVHMEDVKVTLEEDDIDNITTDKFKNIIKNDELEGNQSEDLKSKYKCTICMMKFEDEDMVSKLKCNHIFHEDCVKEWLKEYSYKCPVCRAECGKPKYDL